MSTSSDQAFARVNKWVMNNTRQASPFYIVVMIVTLLMIAFADPTAGVVSACIGLAIVGWRDIDNVSRGDPTAMFFKEFHEEFLEDTCKYYADAMRSKGVPEDVAILDNAILRYYHQTCNLTYTYMTLMVMMERANMSISLKEPNEPESVQQTELPPVPASESSAGSKVDPLRDPDAGS